MPSSVYRLGRALSHKPLLRRAIKSTAAERIGKPSDSMVTDRAELVETTRFRGSFKPQRRALLWLLLCIALAVNSACSCNEAVPAWHCPPSQKDTRPQARDGVFIVGGIHQAHEKARHYSYAQMGQVYRCLHPDVLAIEVEQKFIDDGSDHGMPFDFSRFMVPLARQGNTPVVGIDWWDEEEGQHWQELQTRAAQDPRLKPELQLLGSMFDLLDGYFIQRDFLEINSDEVTQLWAAKSAFKYRTLSHYPEYKPIVDYEQKRNQRMLARLINVVNAHPNSRILVGVGIDHKYWLERELRAQAITVLSVDEVIASWP